MFRIDKDELISELSLTPNGSAGWLTNKDEVCPFCGKGGKKWGIHFNDAGNNGVFFCFKCGHKTNLKNFLEKINRLDLAKINYENSVKISKLTPLIKEKDEGNENPIELTECKLPRKLEYLKEDEYLNNRGFNKRYYKEFKPAITNFFLDKKLRDKIIFQFTMNGKTTAWLARSKKSKEWHEKNLKAFKEGKEKLVLRYENSTDGFSRVLGGYDNITDTTDTIIIVEGLFDYISVDDKLHLYESDEIKCIFTFGNNMGTEQIKLLRLKRSVRNIILLYDPDKPEMIKSTALTLQKYFNIGIACLKDKKKDPGDASQEELLEALDEIMEPINFYTNNLV
jgi:5S rRNA maturation endonuclease (ribonuclease M5)